MSKITDFQTAVQANFDKLSTDLDEVGTEIKALNDQIQALQNSAGALSPEDQAALDAISSASANLVAKADSLTVTAPPPPSSPPTA